MIDEDACMSLGEIASALNISSRSASSILRNRLGYRKDKDSVCVSVCLSVTSHISETSEAIAITEI